ncbi:OLC1v1029189C1 [Oldenlandia corymbosa var. corymbosa]|uniref:OLC1v1029189C1 n=1 Tax=Oldenlandia corymbosa var. corymbosa TaxID=529605 RepID=A0AAV1CE25_OLDCO|nr:OLC1v1029189C1 [Oldenlandia corymbosa var. corymbosa]
MQHDSISLQRALLMALWEAIHLDYGRYDHFCFGIKEDRVMALWKAIHLDYGRYDHFCFGIKEDRVMALWKAIHLDYGRYDHFCFGIKEDRVGKIEKVKKDLVRRVQLGDGMEGLRRLLRAEKVLSYSYPFAYYMFGDNLYKDGLTEEQRELKQCLFEMQQQHLEAMAEKLSLLLLSNRSEGSRMEILDLSRTTEKYCRRFYDCFRNNELVPIQQFAASCKV